MEILISFLPETLLVAFAIILLSLTLSSKQRSVDNLMAFFGILLVGASAYALHAPLNSLFSGSYRTDLFSQGFKVLLSLSFLITILFSKESSFLPLHKKIEYYFFLITSLLGMMMIPSSANILTLFISLELSAYSLYLLASFRKDARSSESAIKYLLFGAATTGIFLWGVSLISGLAGTISLPEIAQKTPALIHEPAFLLGLVFTSFSFLFKLSGFPLHFWAPDVYESAYTPITSFIATASKAAAIAVLIRFFLWMGISESIITILAVFAFISMTLGNTVALIQQDVKRLLAYSSIAQAGYILVGLLANSPEGYSSSLFYAVAYVLMNSAAFLVVLLITQSIKNDNPQISHFDGLAEKSPFLSLLLLLSLLSLAGIPPLAGFTGKWILFSAAMNKGHWFLVLWGVLNSVVSLFYYLTLVKHAYLEKPKDAALIQLSAPLQLTGFLLLLLIILLGVFPNPLITFAQEAILGASLIS